MLPFAEKRSTFSSGVRGPTDLCSGPPHAHDLQHARQFSVEQNDELRALQRLIYSWSSGHWQLEGVVDAQKSGQFKLCHITGGEYFKGITTGRSNQQEDLQLGDVELR